MTRRPPRSRVRRLQGTHAAVRFESPTRLLPQRAFVVHLRELVPSDATSGGLAGRIEHVMSGRIAEFQSLAELSQFMRRMAGREACGEEDFDLQPAQLHAAKRDREQKAKRR